MTNHRLFKFRVWDAYLKTLTQGDGLTIGFTDGKLSEVSFYDKENCSCWSAMDQDLERGNRFFAQQFTGLTDSTGKEIYEGDICRYKWDRHDHDIEASIGEVFFEDGIFLFGRKDLFCTSDSNFRIDSLEVIGNVFENPDL